MKNISTYLALGLFVALIGCGEKDTTAKKVDVDYLGAVSKAKKTAVKVLDVASLTQAIQTFHANEDRYPTSLAELVSTHYLPSIPALPTGMRYNYNPASGVVKVLK